MVQIITDQAGHYQYVRGMIEAFNYEATSLSADFFGITGRVFEDPPRTSALLSYLRSLQTSFTSREQCSIPP